MKIQTVPKLPNLKKIRIKLSLTLREVANKTGISDGYISQIESGFIKDPSYNKIKALLDYYAKVNK